MMIYRTSSRKSVPTFTNKRQRRPVRVQDRSPALKRNQVAAQKRVPVSVTAATSSMPSSKSWTRTRKSNGAQRQNIGERTHSECWWSHSAITNFPIASTVVFAQSNGKSVAAECGDQVAAATAFLGECANQL